MSSSIHLSSLSIREAVVDALYRCVMGLDIADQALFDSAWMEDSVLDINGTSLEGLDAIRTGCYEPIARLDTVHFITNPRVDIKPDETKAHVSANILAQHYRHGEGLTPGTSSYLTGGFYFVDCVKDEKDGLWKAKHWKLKFMWTTGDKGVMDKD